MFVPNPWAALKRQQEEFDDAIGMLEATTENLHAANQRMKKERDEWRAKYNSLAIDFDLFVASVEEELSKVKRSRTDTILGTARDSSATRTQRQSMPYKGD